MRRSPYTPQQQMSYESCECDAASKKNIPFFLIDKIADEKLTGRYNTKKSNLCDSCFTYKSKNGSCNC
jgi:hypothetical protein